MESPALPALSTAEIELFKTQGFLIKRGALSAKLLVSSNLVVPPRARQLCE